MGKIKKSVKNIQDTKMEHNMNVDGMDNDGNRLLEAKNARKRVELDARALANRIHLLEHEEKKVLTKIDETKKKALNVMVIKKRNKDHDNRKDEFYKSKTESLHQKKAKVENVQHE